MATICLEVATETLGIKPTNRRPWLAGHLDTLQGLDAVVSQALARDREALRFPRPWTVDHLQHVLQVRRDLNTARRRRRRQVAEWETLYWSELATRALEAEHKRNLGELFALHRLLGAHMQVRRRDGGRVIPADIEGEREAWRQHFQTIQAGAGQVPEHVWNNIPQPGQVATWLDTPPTGEEVERVIGQLSNRKAAGEDGFMAEFLKYGGADLLQVMVTIVQKSWADAVRAPEGREADNWPDEWKVGLVVPLWKHKGSREDKNTWCGVTLSVGAKVMARLVANRLARWVDPWLHETQNGFRGGRGTDDANQVSRRIAEEISRVASDEVVLLRFFDIEKAYPRVCRAALWKVLGRRGCAPGMIRILKAIHEHTVMKVKVYNGVSEGYVPDRGLREGCPSSPVLFNVYHDAVMQDFRARRRAQAADMGWTPGIQWEYKVDGKLCKRHTVRTQAGQETGTVTVGDMGYADDTAIVGEADEAMAADRLFSQVCLEWEEKVHPGKTEGLRLSGMGKHRTDVKSQGEVEAVKLFDSASGGVSSSRRGFVWATKEAGA